MLTSFVCVINFHQNSLRLVFCSERDFFFYQCSNWNQLRGKKMSALLNMCDETFYSRDDKQNYAFRHDDFRRDLSWKTFEWINFDEIFIGNSLTLNNTFNTIWNVNDYAYMIQISLLNKHINSAYKTREKKHSIEH